MQTQLLCTFSTIDTLDFTLSNIKESYIIVYNYIYILQNTDASEELFVTYNIQSDGNASIQLVDTILIHRKKQTNTIYTINALNALIKSENDGRLDVNYPLKWENYRNSIILTSIDGIRKVPTKVYKKIECK